HHQPAVRDLPDHVPQVRVRRGRGGRRHRGDPDDHRGHVRAARHLEPVPDRGGPMTAIATGAPVATAPPAKPQAAGTRRLINSVWGLVAWIAGIVFVFPVIWMVLTSFKQEQDAASNPPTWFFIPSMSQDREVFSRNIPP